MHIHRLSIGLIAPLIVLSLLACAPASSESQAGDGGVRDALLPWIEAEVKAKNIPSLSIAVVDDQRVVFAASVGYADPQKKLAATPDTPYRVGSVSKPFTALLMMIFVELGLIDLDVPVQTYWPEFQPKNKYDKKITLRQMLSHRSGLVREGPVGNYFDDSQPSIAATVKSLNDTELVYEPGTTTSYSNMALSVAGYVLEKTQKEPFEKLMKRKLLDPIGMTNSSFTMTPKIREKLPKSVMWTYWGRTFPAPEFDFGFLPAGNLYASVNDMAKFMKFLFAGGKDASMHPVLKRETLEKMYTIQFGTKDDKFGFGLGFFVAELEGQRAIRHGGAVYGFATEFMALPDEKLGVIVCASKDVANAVTSRIAITALKHMLAAKAGKPLPKLENSKPLDPEVAKALAGRYRTIATAPVGAKGEVGRQGAAQDDIKAIQGDWNIEKIEANGGNLISNKEKKERTLRTASFKGNQLYFYGELAGTFTLDPTKSPKHLDHVYKDHLIAGIYKLENDTLHICWSDSAERPMEFKTSRAKPSYRLLTLKRNVGTRADDKIAEFYERDGKLYVFPCRLGVKVDVRQIGNELIADDAHRFGLKIERDGKNLKLGKDTYEPIATEKPAPLPAKWAGLIGEYGRDFNVLYILEKDGSLHALIEWQELYPLQEISENVYKFPELGLYMGDKITFIRDASGQVTAADAASVLFKRRPLPKPGETFKIDPVRPVAELRKIALKAKPPIEKNPLFRKPELVDLTTLDKTIKLDIRYATTNNFLGTPFYTSARAFMQKPAAAALVKVHKDLAAKGYGLLIHDAYRPWHVTKMFWDATPDKFHHFVADPLQGSRHNRGCAVDLTLYDLKTGEPIEMPGGYDEMTDRSYPDYLGGTSLQRWHRDLLRNAMEQHGFKVYEAEWWHFDYRDWRLYPILNERFEDLAK